MIKRIVKLTLHEKEAPIFIDIYESSKDVIKEFKGCQHLELLRDISQPNVFFTFSQWENEEALNAYRNSDFFKKTWAKTKSLFADHAVAWSLVPAE